MTAPLTQEQRTVHFLNRTSFGPTRETIERANRMGARAQLGPRELSKIILETP